MSPSQTNIFSDEPCPVYDIVTDRRYKKEWARMLAATGCVNKAVLRMKLENGNEQPGVTFCSKRKGASFNTSLLDLISGAEENAA